MPLLDEGPLLSSRHLLRTALAAVALWPGHWIRDGLAAQEAQEGAAARRIVVEGRVVDHETEGPLVGATVSLGAGPSGTRGRGTRVSDDEGRFRFEDVPAGTYRLSVSASTYRDMTDTLEVSAEKDLELILPLSRGSERTEPIIVATRRPEATRRGYEERRRSGSGFVVTREEILRRQPRYLTELLHGVPGGMVVPTTPYGYTLLLRGQCRPGIWMDGTPLGGATGIDQLLAPMDAEAVEVFHGFELPVEFGVDPCGGVLLWTRRGNPDAGSASGSGWGLFETVVRTVALVAILLVLAR